MLLILLKKNRKKKRRRRRKTGREHLSYFTSIISKFGTWIRVLSDTSTTLVVEKLSSQPHSLTNSDVDDQYRRQLLWIYLTLTLCKRIGKTFFFFLFFFFCLKIYLLRVNLLLTHLTWMIPSHFCKLQIIEPCTFLHQWHSSS